MKQDNTIVKFSYSRSDKLGASHAGETEDDGVATYLAFGIHLCMWGGEVGHYFTHTSGQSGDQDFKLIISKVDDTEVYVKSWHHKAVYGERGVGDEVYVATTKRVKEIAREAAEACSEGHLDEASVARIAAMFFDMSDYENC